MAQLACSFCLKKQERQHTAAPFIGPSLKVGIPVLPYTIFDVADDGLSPYACRNCITSVLRALAETSYKNAQTGAVPLKGHNFYH